MPPGEISAWMRGKTQMKSYKLEAIARDVLGKFPQEIDPDWGYIPEILEVTRDGIGRRVIHIQMALTDPAQWDAADLCRDAFAKSITRLGERRYLPPRRDGARRPRVPCERQELFRQIARDRILSSEWPANQVELAEVLGVAPPAVSAWLSPKRRLLSWEALERFAVALKVHPLEIDPDWDDPRVPEDIYEADSSDAIHFRFTIENDDQASAVAALIKSNPGMVKRAKK
jgi:transcriptional regulator with XRE-family HTH domain